MPVEHFNGGTTLTGNAILGYRGVALLGAIKLYLNTGMRVARNLTAARMRDMATEYTGKTYKRSRAGLESALADLTVLASGKTLDQIGEVLKVNQEVGGVAADLA